MFENVEKVALSGAGPPVKTRGKPGRSGHRLKRGQAGKMFLSFRLSILNMNADCKLGLVNWDPELQAMHVDVLPSWQLAKARPTFSPNCTESLLSAVW